MTNYLELLLSPLADSFSEGQAQLVLSLKLDEQTQRRVDVLREKANDGLLSQDEEMEYKEFIEAVDVISILQAKARQIKDREAA